jgi:hypothetical protein
MIKPQYEYEHARMLSPWTLTLLGLTVMKLAPLFGKARCTYNIRILGELTEAAI